jgi:hypothetical protein
VHSQGGRSGFDAEDDVDEIKEDRTQDAGRLNRETLNVKRQIC